MITGQEEDRVITEDIFAYGKLSEFEDEESIIALVREQNNSSQVFENYRPCLLYTSPSPRDRTRSRMPSSA